MSAVWLPEPPTSTSLIPPVTRRTAVDGSVADALLAATGGHAVWALEPHGSTFLVEDIDGGPAFVREVGDERASRLVAADAIARHVVDEGIRAPLLLSGYPRKHDGRAIVAYRYFDGRFGRPEPADGRSLGDILRRLHDALGRLPDPSSIRDAARDRRALITQRLRTLAAGLGPLGPRPDEARRHADRWADVIGSESPAAAPVHGDIHLANVLWMSDRQVAILDFEDATSAWEAPSFDLAAAIERFALVPGGEDEKLAITIGRAIMEGYGRSVFSRGELAMQLSVRSVKAMALLAEIHARTGASPQGEWDKFMFLLDLTEERKSVVDELEHLGIS